MIDAINTPTHKKQRNKEQSIIERRETITKLTLQMLQVPLFDAILGKGYFGRYLSVLKDLLGSVWTIPFRFRSIPIARWVYAMSGVTLPPQTDSNSLKSLYDRTASELMSHRKEERRMRRRGNSSDWVPLLPLEHRRRRLTRMTPDDPASCSPRRPSSSARPSQGNPLPLGRRPSSPWLPSAEECLDNRSLRRWNG